MTQRNGDRTEWTPGPWNVQRDGQIWSDDHPVAVVTESKWGDEGGKSSHEGCVCPPDPDHRTGGLEICALLRARDDDDTIQAAEVIEALYGAAIYTLNLIETEGCEWQLGEAVDRINKAALAQGNQGEGNHG